MAQLFGDEDNTSFMVDSTPVTDYPVTISAWFRTTSLLTQTVVSIVDKDSSSGRVGMQLTSRSVRGIMEGSANATWATSATAASGVWSQGAVVLTNSSERHVYLDGTNKVSDTTSVTWTAASDRISIGRFGDLTQSDTMDGAIAEVGIWNVALSDSEISLLGKAVSPLLVRPEALVFYTPLIGRYSPEIDIMGGLNLTDSGSFTAQPHPRIFTPQPYRYVPLAAPLSTQFILFLDESLFYEVESY